MLVLNQYKKAPAIPEQTNAEFLASQAWQLKHIFFNEISAIKNTNLEYIAFSEPFAEGFNFRKEMLGKCNPEDSTKSGTQIVRHEQEILQTRKQLDIPYQFKQGRMTSIFMMRKRALINPSTNDCVGIIILAAKLDFSVQRRIMLRHFLSMEPEHNVVIPTSELSEQQQQVITCLLLGFQQRKEIADILGKITEIEYSEGQIKNLLQALYQKFSCTSLTELINIVAANLENPIPFRGINT